MIINEYRFKGTCINVVDGDTIDVNLDLGFGIRYATRLRLLGIDAYETTLRADTTPEQKKKGLEAKDFVKSLILDREIVVETIKDKKGKYGRYLGIIKFKNKDGYMKDLGLLLEKNGFADFI